MIVSDYHDVVVLGQSRSVVIEILRPDLRASVAGGKASPVRVKHHGTLAAVGDALRPDVQEQALFAGQGGLPFLRPAGVGLLDGLGAVDQRIPHASPGLQLGRGLEAILSLGRARVGDALEQNDAIGRSAAHLSIGRFGGGCDVGRGFGGGRGGHCASSERNKSPAVHVVVFHFTSRVEQGLDAARLREQLLAFLRL